MRIASGRIFVALHELTGEVKREREALPLLAMHELGASHQSFAGLEAHWPGPVYALDFAGHGASDAPRGRAYSAEQLWVADADNALAHIGRAAVVGRGVGAYVALLLAGVRTDAVCGALLLAGRGARANGEAPDARREAADRAAFFQHLESAQQETSARPDPLVFETEMHHRPADFARTFAERAQRLLFGPLAADADAPPAPEWWKAARAAKNSEDAPAELADALAQLRARV